MDAIADVVADAVRRSISDMSSSSIQASGSRSRSLEPQNVSSQSSATASGSRSRSSEPQNVSPQSSATDSLADMTSYQSRRSGQSSSQSEHRLLKGTFSICCIWGLGIMFYGIVKVGLIWCGQLIKQPILFSQSFLSSYV